ncbi:MAG TPA: hypothetical protein VK851_02300, partial [Anaerolineales bacterium]|nr:hypothetical protein [Anaerolineales bacterium]
MNLILIGGILILILLIVGVVVTISGERSLVEDRLGQFLEDEEGQEARDEASRSIVTEWVNRRVARSSAGDRVARELARADLKFKVAEYYALVFMSTIVVGVIALLLQPHPVSFTI